MRIKFGFGADLAELRKWFEFSLEKKQDNFQYGHIETDRPCYQRPLGCRDKAASADMVFDPDPG